MKSADDLRKEKLNARKQMTKTEAAEKSRSICRLLRQDSWVQNAETVLTYLPYGKEASLLELNQYFWQRGVRVLAPVCSKTEKGIMDAVAFTAADMANLQKTELGVFEPVGCEIVDPKEIDLVLVPGVVFAKNGGRMGHGMGYYDRFLPKLRQDAKAVGIGYELQVTDNLPLQPWDYLLDALCTEKAFFKF